MSVLFSVLLVLLGIAAFAGGLVSWISLSRIGVLEKRLSQLERDQVGESAAQSKLDATPVIPTSTELFETRDEAFPDAAPDEAPAEIHSPPSGAIFAKTVRQLRDNWMIAFGGLCVGLAGIFLVKYSIDRELLGPTGRILLAVAIGVILHGVAEWLRRRTGESHAAFAALAGGASITLFAAVLAALHLYQLLQPGIVFFLLAAIALATMVLSLVHGPVLAIIGLLGAYVVPILVSTDNGTILIALIYSLIISGAALLLMRWVYRPWLWFGVLAGGLFWWLLSIPEAPADSFRGFYLAILAYGMLAIRSGDWLLGGGEDKLEAGGIPLTMGSSFQLRRLPLSLVLISCAFAFSIAVAGFGNDALLCWSPYVIVILLAARNRPDIAYLPWLTLVLQWFAWLFAVLIFDHSQMQLAEFSGAMERRFLWFALSMSALYSGLSWWHIKTQGFTHLRSSLAAMAPVCWLALAYLLVTDLSIIWQWSLFSLTVGFAYLAIFARLSYRESSQHADPLAAPWLILAAHLAFSLAMVMLFREATLTLALAVQLISVTWLIRKYELPALDWLVKAIVLLIVARLTLNPWLLSYSADTHWSLWTYGGATACALLAARFVEPIRSLRKWLEAAALHLFVLFMWAEIRYWLYGGDIFSPEVSLTETALNTNLWGVLGLVYYYRSGLSQTLRMYYVSMSRVLMTMALISYFLALTVLNPLWADADVSATPVFNLLLLAYGAPPLVALLAWYGYEDRFKALAGKITAVGMFVFVSLQIRHLWQGTLDLGRSTSDGELYTYSGVWMLLAVAAILYGGSRQVEMLRKGGMGLLLLVIAKVFLIDMSGLEGLWRVASFMGLGLSLLALAYLYQRVLPKVEVAP